MAWGFSFSVKLRVWDVCRVKGLYGTKYRTCNSRFLRYLAYGDSLIPEVKPETLETSTLKETELLNRHRAHPRFTSNPSAI